MQTFNLTAAGEFPAPVRDYEACTGPQYIKQKRLQTNNLQPFFILCYASP